MRLKLITKKKINNFVIWLISITSYTIILMLVAILFESIYIDNSYFGLWAFLTSIIVYILNRTIKPIIFLLTLPLTGFTLGLFYPFINVFILKLTDWLLGYHFETEGILILFVIALLISVLNFLAEKVIIYPITKKG